MKKIVGLAELAFRHGIVYPLFRLIFRNPISDRPIELQKVRKLLILRYDRIGDMIVTTPIFRRLKKAHPRLHIGVVTSALNAELVRNNPNVDAVYILHANWFSLWREIRRARRERYDIVLNFIFNRTTSGGLLANIIAPKGFKVGQGDPKYQFYFNRLLVLERSESHMVETLSSIVQQVFDFSTDEEELGFEIVVDEGSTQSVDKFLKKQGIFRRVSKGKGDPGYVVFNLSATDLVRRISARQAEDLARSLAEEKSFRTVLIYAPGDEEMRNVARKLAESSVCVPFPEMGTASLLEIASLIEGAFCVITPDTAIVHFASAMKTPVLGLFTPLQGMHEWLPHKVRHDLVTAEAGQPVSSISLDVMRKRVKGFIQSVQPGRAPSSSPSDKSDG